MRSILSLAFLGLLCMSVPAMADVKLSAEEAADGFVLAFDGKTHDGWVGDTKGYIIQDESLICAPGGNIYLADEYKDFIFRFEFKLPSAGNNGVGIRCERGKDAAYYGMEIQVLDNSADCYKGLQPYQFHGSIYGVVAADKDCQKPVGEWNTEEISAQGGKIKVTVNGKVIVDADISDITETRDHRSHPGLHNEKGYIGFLGHGARVEFRNIRIKNLSK